MNGRMQVFLAAAATWAALTAVSDSSTPRGVGDDCLACMCWASSNCSMPTPVCKMNGWGEVCGPWAITEPYWVDGGRLFNNFYKCVEDWKCNEDTVRNYLDRYVTDSDAKCQDYARTHAGGPLGAWNDGTLPYWYSVKDCLDYGIFTPPSA
ncbi:lysozyme-like [Penaeus chinensis]|uniref:lysozyme-like n=1 Tax=Penaeus chinensis TaxID=139456 RepID=UPI001FB5D8B2|nr:lysozyme-like [Penaeus chinensis]